MKTTSLVMAGVSAVLLFALTGCVTYVNPPPPAAEVHVVTPPPPPQPPVIVIHHEYDFYEPLSPYGSWVVVGSYGRVWRPVRVSAEWRPYSHGYWQRTDAGWYWASDEPWGWATYHYGRWDWTPEYGWVWIPQTQWAPAWVTWRQGAGYVGWAPLPPTARFTGSVVEVREPVHAPRAFVFVEERRLLEPVRPQTVVVNNQTVINKTVNITKIKVVNKTVVNEGPRPEAIERVSGRKVHPVPTHDLRRKEETEVASRQRSLPSTARNTEPAPGQVTAPPARATVPSERPATVTTSTPAQTPNRDVRKPVEQSSTTTATPRTPENQVARDKQNNLPQSNSSAPRTNIVAAASEVPPARPVETGKQPQRPPARQAQQASETKSNVAVTQRQTPQVQPEKDRAMARDKEPPKMERAAAMRSPHLPPKQAEMQADMKKGKAAAAKAENARKKKKGFPEETAAQETPPQTPPPATPQP